MEFIVILILINFLLFLPRYLLGLPGNWNPFKFLLANDSLKDKAKVIYFARAIDPFRISIEFTTIAAVLFLSGINHQIAVIVMAVIALLIFTFNVYAGIFLNMLHRTPILKSDVQFIRESISIYEGYIILSGIGILLLLALFGSLFYYLSSFLFATDSTIWPAVLLFAFTLLNGLWNLSFYELADYFSRTFFSLIVFIKKSNEQSKAYDQLFSLTKEDFQALNIFSEVKLKTKPNIHILSMESYGSVLYRDQETYASIQNSVSKWEQVFTDSPISVCSSFVTPPLFATGTWYTYSTLLFGMKIDNQTQHNVLFNEMPNFTSYESLFQFTKRVGYENYTLQGMIGTYENTLDFEKLKRNLNYDRLWYNEDLEYSGQVLKFMNMQNCSPDQYTFNRGMDIAEKINKPYTLFNCTLNSHWDFHSPLEIVDDWQQLNQPGFTFETTMDKKQSIQDRYTQSIQYTIDSVFDTIHKRAKSNDIFIVYGDHQPTTLTDIKFGKETPIHIFSRDQNFISAWKEFGFAETLVPIEQEDCMKFEGFYSAFMICFNRVYGEDADLDIEYLGDGVFL